MKRECFSHSVEFYFINHTKRNNASFNYVKTNLNSLLFTFLSTNFNAFLIPHHWLANQPLKLLLPCNVFQSFLINLDLKMIYYYLSTMKMDLLPVLGFSLHYYGKIHIRLKKQTKITYQNTENF